MNKYKGKIIQKQGTAWHVLFAGTDYTFRTLEMAKQFITNITDERKNG